MREILKVTAAIVFALVLMGGAVYFKVYQIRTLSKATGMSFWKSAIVLMK